MKTYVKRIICKKKRNYSNDKRYLELQMSKTTKATIKVHKRTGIIESDSNIKASTMRFKIDEIKPENFYMHCKLVKSKNNNYYGELVYLHNGKWYKPSIIISPMDGCRLYTNRFGITTLVGSLSPEDENQRKTAEKIVQIHNRVQTIIRNHPRLRTIRGGEFPITRFLRRREDVHTGEVSYILTAEIEEKREVRHNNYTYTFNGTIFADKNGIPIKKGNPILDLKNKELDIQMSINLSLIIICRNRDGESAIYNKIKAVAIKVKEAREIVQDDDSDEDSDNDSEDDSND